MRTTKPSIIAALFHAAAAGKTRREAAGELGMNYYWVCNIVRTHKIPFRHGLKVKETKHPRVRGTLGAVKASGVLDQLSTKERLDTLILIRKGGYDAPAAFRAIGRADLVPAIEMARRAEL